MTILITLTKPNTMAQWCTPYHPYTKGYRENNQWFNRANWHQGKRMVGFPETLPLQRIETYFGQPIRKLLRYQTPVALLAYDTAMLVFSAEDSNAFKHRQIEQTLADHLNITSETPCMFAITKTPVTHTAHNVMSLQSALDPTDHILSQIINIDSHFNTAEKTQNKRGFKIFI